MLEGCIGKTKARNNIAILPHLEYFRQSVQRGGRKASITVCGFSALESPEVRFCKLEYLIKCHSHNSLIFFSEILVPITN